MADVNVMEKIVSLCKRRGFIYPASEIYGGLNGFWDYGPLGVLLKNNIRDWWWRNMVITPPIGPDGHPIDIVGLDSAIIQNPKTWVASGHVGGFSDPMVEDKETKQRFRADHLFGFYAQIDLPGGNANAPVVEALEAHRSQTPDLIPLRTVVASSAGEAITILESDRKLQKSVGISRLERMVGYPEESAHLTIRGKEVTCKVKMIPQATLESHHLQVPSPFTGNPGALTEPRQFNLMFGTEVGAVDPVKAYLRPETAQGIFLQYKNILDTTRVKVPFGVAQVGKSFRNEVTPRNYIFRSREFEQMEMEWFCHPDEARKWFDFWKEQRMNWWRSLGVSDSRLRFRDHAADELSFYSKMTVDIEYLYPFTAPNFGELEGIAHRGSYDLTQHQEHSGQKLDYFDQDLQLKLKEQGVSPEEVKSRSRYIPNVIEPASGLTRAVLVVLCEAYRHEPGRQGTEEMLSIRPQFAPIKCGVFPLVQ
ncbi:MAG TPA: glycine--tRNA ligase, partial [Tepidisphaeraceae bacterium]|nr:glycine--tRNA ligase [Tepidisphaeraceae bacterium]